MYNKAVEQFIIEYLKDKEDIYLSEQVLTEIRSGKQKTYSADEIFKRILAYKNSFFQQRQKTIPKPDSLSIK